MSSYLGGLILLALLVPLAAPYLAEGYQFAHDRAVPYMRVKAIEQAVAEGQLPPRWFPEFDGGYGSPYPSFYGMLFYDVAALAEACCVSLGQSVELSAFLVAAASGVGMFFLARRLWGTSSGILSAGLYLYAPYHLVDAFVRGAYSELTSFVWFPLILLFMVLWRQSGGRLWILTGGVSLAGLVLTHNIMPLIFLPSLPLLGLAIVFGNDGLLSRRNTVIGWVGMGVLGALISAFFWLPVAADRQLIHTEYFLQVDYRDEFVGFGQLLTTSLEHGLTPELGIPLVIAAVSGQLVAGLSDKTRATKPLVAMAGLLSLGYIFMMNFRSAFIWANLPLLDFIQLPWRLLAPTTFLLSLMAGALPAAVASKWWGWCVALAFPMFALQLHSPLFEIPLTIGAATVDQQVTCQDVWGTQDYRPRWSAAAYWLSSQVPETLHDTPFLPPCATGVRILPPEAGTVLESDFQGTTLSTRYRGEKSAVIEFPQFYYPTWVVTVDGIRAHVSPAPRTGLLHVQAPAGQHQVVAKIGPTAAQVVGLLVTGLGTPLALLAALKLRTSV